MRIMADYISGVVPDVQRYKLCIWRHDAIVLHDIRKSKGPFAILLTDRAMRERLNWDFGRLVEAALMTVVAAVTDKPSLRTRYADTRNPYRIARRFCMEQLHAMSSEERQRGKTVHVIFESRAERRTGNSSWSFVGPLPTTVDLAK